MRSDEAILTRRAYPTVFLIAGLYIFFWALHGYNYATNVHHDQVVPFVLKSLHPEEFDNDPYVATLARYPSLFPWVVGLIAKTGCPLAVLFGLLQTITVFVLITGMVHLLAAWLESFPAVVLASSLVLASQFLNGQSFFGEDAIFRGYLEPTTVSWAVLLWALSFWFRRRPRWAFLLLGLAADINPLPAFHVGLALVISELLSARTGPAQEVAAVGELAGSTPSYPRKRVSRWGGSIRGPWIPASAGMTGGGSLEFFGNAACTGRWREVGEQWGWNAVVGAAASAPLLIRMARMPARPAVNSLEVVQSLKAWYPFHYFPDTWPPGKWLLAIAYVLLYLVLLVQVDPALRQRLQAWMAATALVISFGFAAAWLQSSLLIRMQFFRADALLVLFGIALTARAAADRFLQGSLRGVLWGGMLAATATIWFCWPLVFAAVLGLVLEQAPELSTVRRIFWVLVLGACFWSINRCAGGQSALVSPYIGLALSGTAILMLLPPHPLRPAARKALSAGLLILAFSPLLALLRERLAQGTLSNVDPEMRPMVEEWFELQSWCRQHTRSQSRFIVPSDMWSFRIDSERSVFFHWVDGAAIHWDPGYVATWRERLAAVHGDLPAMERQWSVLAKQRYPTLFEPRPEPLPPSPIETAFDALTAEDFRRLKGSYHLDYLVTKATAPSLPFPVLVQGRYFRLHELNLTGSPGR